MTTSGIDTTNLKGAASASVAAASPSPFAANEEQFLQLLVAQISNQDPLNPMEDKDMITQLAQFSSVEQAIEMNRRLAALQGMTSTQDRNNLASLIGKQITASGDTVQKGNGPTEIAFDLQADAKEVDVRLIDAAGKVVRTLHAGSRNHGVQKIQWDGKGDSAKPLGDGAYRVEVKATDATQHEVRATTQVSGTVTGVAFDDQGAAIMVGNRRIRPNEVREISTPTQL